MVSTLKERGNSYYCSNCQMRQPQIKSNCWWCGNMFSNWESVLFKELIEEEKRKNESKLHVREATETSVET